MQLRTPAMLPDAPDAAMQLLNAPLQLARMPVKLPEVAMQLPNPAVQLQVQPSAKVARGAEVVETGGVVKTVEVAEAIEPIEAAEAVESARLQAPAAPAVAKAVAPIFVGQTPAPVGAVSQAPRPRPLRRRLLPHSRPETGSRQRRVSGARGPGRAKAAATVFAGQVPAPVSVICCPARQRHRRS